uniref:COMM domain-containing protein 3 n=1 Tax=Labrus bergylta TaxID=56723 RepID=A0A3Q3H2F9_9LABR
MELSESVQRGLQSLADPSSFEQSSFQVLAEVSFRSLLSSHADPAVLDLPELKHIDQILLKQTHTAATTFILEAVKQNADKSTISSCLEELTFSAERIETFYSTYQKHTLSLCGTVTCQTNICFPPPRQNAQVDKVNEPFYSISLNTENNGSTEDINFTCTMEQLQDLVGKLKDAAKSVEKASQM